MPRQTRSLAGAPHRLRGHLIRSLRSVTSPGALGARRAADLREQCSFGAYQLWHADQIDLAPRVPGAYPVPVLWNWAGAEAPEVSVEVAGAVSAVAVAVGVGFAELAGAGGLRTLVVGVDVVDDHVDPSVAKVAAVQVRGAVRLDQGGTVSGSHNRADFVKDVAFESERFREPG